MYTSSTKALALLELLAHLDVAQPLPPLVAFTVPLDEKLVEHWPVRALPRGWRSLRGLGETRAIGDAWLAARRSLALAVPSVVVPEELHYLLDPEHPAFARLRVGAPTPFQLDRRLV